MASSQQAKALEAGIECGTAEAELEMELELVIISPKKIGRASCRERV